MTTKDWSTILKGAIIGTVLGIIFVTLIYVFLNKIPIATTTITIGCIIWTFFVLYKYVKSKHGKTDS